MNNFVIMTSIFDPTEAVQEFDRKSDLSLIVVGDKKTPKNYFLENGTFLSVEKKEGFYIENTFIKSVQIWLSPLDERRENSIGQTKKYYDLRTRFFPWYHLNS